MTRLWAEGLAVQVEMGAEGQLRAFHWARRTHRIQHLANRWRVDQGWWQARVWREYVKVVTDTGLLAVLYRDLPDGGWYLQRLYD